MNGNKSKGKGIGRFLKKLVIAVLAVEAALIVFVFALFHLIPDGLYESFLATELEKRAGLTMKSASFSTAFPLAFVLEGVKFSDASGREVLRFDTVRAGVNPLGHFGGVKITIDADVSGAEVDGVAKVGFFGSSFDMEARKVGFDAIPALERAGVKLDGAFDAILVAKADGGCPRGSFKVQSVELKGAELSFRGMPLPIDDIDEAGLSAEFSDCSVRVDGLWIDGKDLSARMKGTIRVTQPVGSSPVDMTIELMPNEGLLKKEFLLSLIEQYKKSANYYSIPVKGTLEGLFGGR